MACETNPHDDDMATSLLKDWTEEDFATVEHGVLLARHRLHETGLFSDEGLCRIIDSHPDKDFSINTMGHDANKFEWREGDRNGLPADEILRLVKEKHFWINCRRMLDHHKDVRDAVNDIYDELEAKSPGFSAIERSANLLISSPDALVPYHIDIPVNMLWHIRGRKRVFVYPHFDFRFASQKVTELVCAGELSEDVPYDSDWDKYALVYEPEPGDLLTWPQLTPHYVQNLEGLCASLSTEHQNPRAIRRMHVHRANHLLRTKFGMNPTHTEVEGMLAHAKQFMVRVAGKLQYGGSARKKAYTYPITFKLDPTAPEGYVLINDTTVEETALHLALDKAS